MKIAERFFSPSCVVFFLMVLGLVLLFWTKYRREGKIITAWGVLLYYCFSITPFSDFLLYPLEHPYAPTKLTLPPGIRFVVVLLGGRESNILRASVVFEIYGRQPEKEQAPKVVLSGRDPLDASRRPAEELREFLVAGGIPPRNIILDEGSGTTDETARNIKKLLGSTPFVLVTSAYHMSRSLLAFRRLGINPFPFPADFERSEGHYRLLDFFPSAVNLKKSDQASHEYAGILFYRLAR